MAKTLWQNSVIGVSCMSPSSKEAGWAAAVVKIILLVGRVAEMADRTTTRQPKQTVSKQQYVCRHLHYYTLGKRG